MTHRPPLIRMMLRIRMGFILFFGPPSLLAKEPGAAFLTIDSSIRKVALGGVSTGAQGAHALGSNPALLQPLNDRSELYTSFLQLWGDTAIGHMAFATDINSKQVCGLSATVQNSQSTTERDNLGQTTGRQTATHHEKGAGAFAWEIKRGGRVGLAGNIFQSTLAGETSGVSWAVDAGASLNVKKCLFSASVNHLGPPVKYLNQQDDLPSVLMLDVSWEPGPLTLLMGYHRLLSGSGTRGALGVEYCWRALALRAGAHANLGGTKDLAWADQSTTKQIMDNLTAGFGLFLGKSLRMDYAYQQSAADWDAGHSVALTWSWGVRPTPQKKFKSSSGLKPIPLPTKPVPPRQKLKK